VSAERPSTSDDALAADARPSAGDPEARAGDASLDGTAAAVDGPLDESAESGAALDGGVPDERDAEAGEADVDPARTSAGDDARVTGSGEVLGGTDHPRDAPSGSAAEPALDDGGSESLGTDQAPDPEYPAEVGEGDVT
jgi:hypothetical protein